MENNPVVRVIEMGPDQVRCRTPTPLLDHPVQEEVVAELGQLAVPALANTVLPRTVASTTGSPAMAARRRNLRRSSLTSSTDEDFSERSRSGRELSAIRIPATPCRPEHQGR